MARTDPPGEYRPCPGGGTCCNRDEFDRVMFPCTPAEQQAAALRRLSQALACSRSQAEAYREQTRRETDPFDEEEDARREAALQLLREELAAATRRAETAEGALAQILELVGRYGGFDEAHHKQWVLDQVARLAAGDRYARWAARQRAGEDGPDTYAWDEGTPP